MIHRCPHATPQPKKADVPLELEVPRTFSRFASCSSQSNLALPQAPNLSSWLTGVSCQVLVHHQEHKCTTTALMLPLGSYNFEEEQSLAGEDSLPQTQRKILKRSSICISGRHVCVPKNLIDLQCRLNHPLQIITGQCYHYSLQMSCRTASMLITQFQCL